MARLVHNRNGGTTDEYGTQLADGRSVTSGAVEGMKVAANGTPNMTVYVQPGSALIPTGTYPSSYTYGVSIDTALPGEQVTIGTAAASARIDYIVAYVDQSVGASTSGSFVNNTNNMFKLADVQGTPAGSPSVPTVSQIQSTIGATNPYIILAQIAVGASVSTITNSNITDLRSFSAPLNSRALGANSYVDSGAVWTQSSGLNGTMTAGTVYINVSGVMIPVSLATIASRAFTASKDTYVAVDYTGSITYNEVSNGASAPTQPTGSVWLAKVVTSGSAITSVTTDGLDSNGKAIYPRARSVHGLYNPIKFSVSATGPTALSNGVATKLQFGTKVYDTGNNFDTTTNYRFTANAPCTVFFTGQYMSTVNGSGSNTRCFVSLYKNGTEFKRGIDTTTPNGGFPSSTVSEPLQLAANDYIELWAFASPGINVDTNWTKFSGFEVSGS